jgi:hypothetical protein
LFEVTEQAMADERWRMCCLMAGKRDREMLGEAEFQLREMVHRVGAITLEAAVNQRRKKGVTTAAALLAPTASRTRSSSSGVPKQS